MELTVLLNRARAGDEAAANVAYGHIYDHLKRIAAAELRRGGRSATLDTTGLVHEAWAKLAGYDGGDLADRQHYFRLAARAMRQVLTDHARSRLADKRGNAPQHLPLESAEQVAIERAEQLVELDEALSRLAAADPRSAQVIELHVFGGLTFDAVAEVLGVSERTARSDYQYARAWLASAMEPDQGPKAS